MLKGIDISNWQKNMTIGNVLNANDIDFCICKATEGVNFVDPYCDGFIQKLIKNNILWGYYHFARGTDARKEARFFAKNTEGYSRKGIPVLDYEVTTKGMVEWCEVFINEYYSITGVYPLLYISASRCFNFKNSWIPKKCGLWVAGYPVRYKQFVDSTLPYNIAPWEFAAIWQFTDSLRLTLYSGNVDGNFAYMTKKAWMKYANPTTEKTNEELADEVIAGIWGNGWNRKNALSSAGYDYEAIQKIVNKKLGG